MTGSPNQMDWQTLPTALLQLSDTLVVDANGAALELLECPLDEIQGNPNWIEQLFGRHAERIQNHLKQAHEWQLTCEIQNLAQNRRFVRLRASANQEILALHDLSDMYEDALVLQAGYDEFLNVTLELEKALVTIEQQKDTLEKQAEKLERELQIARKVQRQVFAADFESYRKVNIAGYYEAMDNLGGDMWYFYEGPDSFIAVIGDVMGHGVAASLVSIAARNFFQSRIRENDSDLAAICADVNQALFKFTHGDYFLTVGAFRITNSNQVEYITCGHPPILLAYASQGAAQSEQLFITQPMLGIFDGLQLKSQTLECRPQDRILLYTDCLIESPNPEGQFLDQDQIAELLANPDFNHPRNVIQGLLDLYRQFINFQDASDDLAMVCVELGEAASVPVSPSV
ncbi:MAG: SpoIIE family protein phosphatase [Leptospiraceae bacterium]|nr:SpoIIE family protein phosphatase [Leptospiraceae bacterium]